MTPALGASHSTPDEIIRTEVIANEPAESLAAILDIKQP